MLHVPLCFICCPLNSKGKIYSLCELCVLSEAGGEKYSLTYPHSKAGTISITEGLKVLIKQIGEVSKRFCEGLFAIVLMSKRHVIFKTNYANLSK